MWGTDCSLFSVQQFAWLCPAIIAVFQAANYVCVLRPGQTGRAFHARRPILSPPLFSVDLVAPRVAVWDGAEDGLNSRVNNAVGR